MSQPAQPETPEQWARRVVAEHGPPPARVVDVVRGIRRRAEQRQQQRPAS